MPAVRDEAAAALLLTAPLVVRAIAQGMRRGEPSVSPAHLGVLLCVARGPLSLRELAAIMSVSAPTASASIDALESRGWVSRLRDPDDRRAVVITVTEAGKEMLARLQAQAQQRVSEMLESLDDDECGRLLEGLRVLRRLLPPTAAVHATVAENEPR